MKKNLMVLVLFFLFSSQHAFCDESRKKGNRMLGTVLIVGGLGALVYEARKSIETDDSGQTKLLGALAITGGLVLYHNSRDNTKVTLTSHQKSPTLNFRLEI